MELMNLNIYAWGGVITAVTNLAISSFIYFKNRRGLVNKIFPLYSLSIGLWSFCWSRMITSSNPEAALLWAKALSIGSIFIPTLFLHFIFVILNITKNRKNILIGSYILAFIFLFFCYFTNLFIKGVAPIFLFNYHIRPGPVYIFHFSSFIVMTIYGAFELFKASRIYVGIKRNQIKYLFWALTIGYVGGITGYFPIYKIPMPSLAVYTIPICIIVITYSIIKYRLMDIDIAIGKIATYSFLLAIISGVCLGLMWGVDRIFSTLLPAYSPFVPHFLIFLLLSIALIYFIPRLKGETGKGIEEVFFKNKFKYREALKEFSKRLVLIPSEEQLLSEAVHNIATAMEVPKVAIMLLDDLSGNYILQASSGLSEKAEKLVFTPQDGIIQWLRENKKVFFIEEMDKILSLEEAEKIKIELKDIEAMICFPLIIHNRLGGVLALGEKRSREMYSHIDIELLEGLTNQLALSISYKRLESQIVRADRLVSLGTLAAGMAHEIRNPLSSIQTFAQLLPEKYNDKEFREEFSKIVASDTQRITRIIDSVMALAKSKPSILEACNINKLLDETLFLIASELKKDVVKVTRNYAEQLPQIKVDKEELQQTFLNIFLNALAALSKNDGKLTISTRQKLIPSVLSGREEKYVQIEIKDNGIGIEKKLLDRIFEPFFTTRPEGTGLGLSIVHRIIEQHKGFIKVDSDIGKGTTFLINLPMERKND